MSVLNNLFERSETTQKIRVVCQEGNRMVIRTIDFYNLDMIISVEYRVNSANATQFRRWATSVLKEYLRCELGTGRKKNSLLQKTNLERYSFQ
ncbi:MAG: virulence RhuM family protein [Bacteroidales bacterium]|nr:virulence RhuM family protein [Bacteroidales bacterium]